MALLRNRSQTCAPVEIATPVGATRREFETLRERTDRTRTRAQRLADRMTAAFGSTAFLVFNTVWFVVWIIWNCHLIPGIHAFDAFPFGMLTMVVSLEAIFLSIFVLIAQNRSAVVDELRAEFDLRINLIAEQELTKLLEISAKIAAKHGIDVSKDAELKAMLTPTDHAEIERELEHQIDCAAAVVGAPKA